MTPPESIVKVVVPVAHGHRLLPATNRSQRDASRGTAPRGAVRGGRDRGGRLVQILFITGRKKSAIEDHFDRDPELVRLLSAGGGYSMLEEIRYTETEARFFYTRQSTPLGLGDAVSHAREFTGDDHFVVALGDSIIKSRDGSSFLREIVASHLRNGAACTVAVEEVPADEVHRYGIVQPKEGADPTADFEIEDLVEKPRPEAAPSNLAIAARYVFSPDIYEAIRRTAPDQNGELQLTDSIRLLIQLGHKVQGYRLQPGDRRYDIGNFESYFKAFIDFAVADEKYGYLVRQYLKRKTREF